MDVENYINLRELEEAEGSDLATFEFPMVKASLNIPDDIDRRVRYISSDLGLKRSEFMRDLLNLALVEFEKHFELDPNDFDKPYANYVYAGIDDFKIGPITVTKGQFIEMMKAARKKEESQNE